MNLSSKIRNLAFAIGLGAIAWMGAHRSTVGGSISGDCDIVHRQHAQLQVPTWKIVEIDDNTWVDTSLDIIADSEQLTSLTSPTVIAKVEGDKPLEPTPAAEPDPGVDPIPKTDPPRGEPGIHLELVDGVVPPGRFWPMTAVADIPEGGEARYDWEFAPGLDCGMTQAGGVPDIVFTADDGDYWASCIVSSKDSHNNLLPAKYYKVEFKVGKPGPPKPLKELAGPDAPALATFYSKYLAALDLPKVPFSSPDDFWNVHNAGLVNSGLQNNGARAAIEKRLSDETAIGRGTGSFPLASGKAALTIIVTELGLVPPGPQPPGPTPPPVPTPDDPWGVAASVRAIVAASPASVKAQAKATADLFDKAAAGLQDTTFGTINQAAYWLQAERKTLWGANASEWSAFVGGINEIWSGHWPMLKSDVINFYRCVASGLRSVQ